MNEWKEVSLSEMGKTITGKTPSSQHPEDFGDEMPFITPSDSFEKKYINKSDRFLSRSGSDRLKEKIISPNSIMVTCIGSAMGKVAKNSLSSVTNQQINSIIVNENFDSDYIYYLLKNNYAVLRNAASGSTAIPILNKTDFDNLRFKVELNLNEQRKMVSILSTIDDKIETNNQINQELEAMAKTLYDYWFVQFDFPDQNGKPYKSSGGKMVYNPELKREIPEGWGVESVGNLLDKVTKAEKIENNSIEFIGEIPVIDQSQKYIAGFTNNENAILQPQDGHVIFGDHTRVVKYINFDYARGADGTQVLISNNENISNVLLYHMIEDFDLSNYGYARHFKFLKEKTVIVPDKEVSSKFETQANVIYEKIKNNIFENQELTQLRDWLLPMLMNGQVRVEDKT